MKDQKAIEKRIEDLIQRLVKEFNLEWLTIRNRFSTALEGDRVVCATEADWEYRQAGLSWNLPMVVVLNDEDLETTAIHELVHVLLAPIWNEIPDKVKEPLFKQNELATENVTRLISAIRKVK